MGLGPFASLSPHIDRRLASPPVADDFRRKVFAAIRSVGAGQVASYGDIAEQAGFPGSARAVGTLLAASVPEDRLPWWRIVTASGRLAPGKEATQARLLAGEGVPLTGGSPPRVRLARRQPSDR